MKEYSLDWQWRRGMAAFVELCYSVLHLLLCSAEIVLLCFPALVSVPSVSMAISPLFHLSNQFRVPHLCLIVSSLLLYSRMYIVEVKETQCHGSCAQLVSGATVSHDSLGYFAVREPP